MMYPSGLKPLAAVAAISILAIAGVAAQERQQPATKGGTVKATPLDEDVLPPFDAGAADLAANRDLARRQLAVIDEAWVMLENLSRNPRIEINGGTIGPWGRRRLEALRRAGAGKAEIVAALEKYSNDLGRFEEICHGEFNHHHPSYNEHEVKYLRMEAEIWLNKGGTVKATPLDEDVLPPFDAGAADLAANRDLARRQLAVIDRAWLMLENLSRSGRMEINEGTIGPWGRRRLEALRRAGAGKDEIVAALMRYSNDLGRFEEICHGQANHHHPSYGEHEVEYLRMEAEFWLNEEKAR